MMNYTNTWQVEHHHTLPSTNDYCIEQAKLGNRTNLAVLADTQTAPRASRGRKWIEPRGNLNFSLLYWPKFSIDKLNWLPFIASLSLYDAVCKLCDNSHNIVIKWPNDLLFIDKKVGGILIESNINLPDQFEWVVIGFGVNIYSAPVLNRQVGCLRDLTKNVPSNLLLSQKITEYFDYWITYLLNEDIHYIRQVWLKRSLPLYSPLSITLDGTRWEGTYNGINEQGLLLLKTDQELKKFSTGEVFWLYNNRNN